MGYIKTEEAVEALYRYGFVTKETIEKNIRELPSIDIVRCKECRYWNTKGCRDGVGECEWAYYMTKPNDFCSYGERKE